MTTPVNGDGGRLSVPVDEHDHLRGPGDASVTLLEYGDFQCPYCRRAYPEVEEVLRRRPRTVRLAYRHFPLTNVHPQAEQAAEVAEAAATRGRFWEMHHWLFENQKTFATDLIPQAAAGVGLDAEEIRREVDEHRYGDRIRADFIGGIHSGANGTPTFFVNDLRHDGGYSAAELIVAVDEAAAAWPTDRPPDQPD